MELKTCSKCDAVKPATLKYFFKHRVNTFGNILLKGRCKDCCRKPKERERELSKQYYERNKEEIKKKRRKEYALKKQSIQISP